VQFQDGTIKAQIGLPDMKLPIQFALTCPERVKNDFPRFNFMDYPQLTFEKPDRGTFKNLDLAYEAMELGGTAACALNAANEVTVQAFLELKIGFLQVGGINEQVMRASYFVQSPVYEDYLAVDKEARDLAELIVLVS
jgi:1-deoxy-D-xylulose-5-phosphate reductoisomerase